MEHESADGIGRSVKLWIDTETGTFGHLDHLRIVEVDEPPDYEMPLLFMYGSDNDIAKYGQEYGKEVEA